MRKSTSLCEFSNTPSVSLMKDKRGQLLGPGAQANQPAHQNQTGQAQLPKDAKPAQAQQQDEPDPFALED
jgi:hypothetical protein